jgi:uncharacterized membrane protein YedE/YeeE
MLSLLHEPWPWYVSGPLIGLMVPLLLVLGNKIFGISSTLRQVCAACFPANIPFFNYNWKKESWNLFFVGGIVIGAFITWKITGGYTQMQIHPALVNELKQYGITDETQMVPKEILNWHSIFTLKAFCFIVVGGFLVGFGTRYAGGCTSGHSISGLSNLQWPSLVATICFMAGGFVIANLILPYILKL